jgi:hypothetical protein
MYNARGSGRLASGGVVEKGRVRKMKDYDKGPMLVHDEEGWRERNESVIKRRLKWSLLALGVFAAGGFVLFGILGVRIGIPPTEVIGTLLILFSYVSATIWFMVWLSFWWLRKRAAWGLYEKGIQINPYVFIPYAEVRQIEVKEAGMGLVKIVILEPTTPMKGWARYNYGRVWRMYYEPPAPDPCEPSRQGPSPGLPRPVP